MALEIRWPENVLIDYKKIIDYLIEDWLISAATEFVDNLESRIETLSVFPNMESHTHKKSGSEPLYLQNIISSIIKLPTNVLSFKYLL